MLGHLSNHFVNKVFVKHWLKGLSCCSGVSYNTLKNECKNFQFILKNVPKH
jgi:hypothetical protein